MFAWMEMTGREKPFYERFDELTKRAWGFLHCALIYSIICVAQVKSIQAQTRGEVALLIPL